MPSNWHGDNDFSQFKAAMPVSDTQIWQAFYELHKDRIEIQKATVAREKLKTIVKATFKLSNQKGFALMTLRDLNKTTGISMGSLYAYIGSKGQLADMIHQFLPRMFESCLGNIADLKADSWQQLLQFIRGHIFLTERMLPWFFFAYMEAKYLNSNTRDLAKKNEQTTENLLITILDRGQKEGCFATLDSQLHSLMIKSLLQHWYLKRNKYRERHIDCEQYALFIEQQLQKTLGPTL